MQTELMSWVTRLIRFISQCILCWLLLIALLILNLYISDHPKFYRPPTALFSIQKAGNTMEVKLHVGEENVYQFDLEFMFKESDPADRARVSKLVGDAPGYIEKKIGDTYVSEHVFSKGANQGVPTPVRLKINAIGNNGEMTVFDKEIKDSVLTAEGSGGYGFDRRLTWVRLKPGNYRVTIESLRDCPELIGTDMTLSMGIRPKSIDPSESEFIHYIKMFFGALGITYAYL